MESINCFVIELYQFRKLAQKEIFVPNGIESENEGRKEVRTVRTFGDNGSTEHKVFQDLTFWCSVPILKVCKSRKQIMVIFDSSQKRTKLTQDIFFIFTDL